MGSDRFADEGVWLVEFLDDVWVRCPRCGGFGHVRTASPYWSSKPTFTCGGCAFVLQGRQSRWYKSAIGRAVGRCATCGAAVSTQVDGGNGRGTSPSVRVRCRGCGHDTPVDVTWTFTSDTDAIEPGFGLDLVLQAPCVGEVLWAYNERHLDFLADYVGAALRERTTNHNTSLASRLPAWMKSAKHRQTVLDAIEELRTMAATSQRPHH